jgi:RNA polymerase sigma-70 factor, ECF subfamily
LKLPPHAERFVGPTPGRADVQARPSGGQESGNEAELLRAVVAGERWAAEALYELVYSSIARSLQRVLHHPSHDYDDLVQTTFERLIRSLAEQAACVRNVAAWASGIATHVALEALRFRIRERRFLQADDANGGEMLTLASSVDAERELEARRELLVVQEVLGKMKAELAETVLLHDMVGHDLAETAALTRVTVAAAQSRLVRGRKELLRRVGQRLARGSL